jgi:hypothetical protein
MFQTLTNKELDDILTELGKEDNIEADMLHLKQLDGFKKNVQTVLLLSIITGPEVSLEALFALGISVGYSYRNKQIKDAQEQAGVDELEKLYAKEAE